MAHGSSCPFDSRIATVLAFVLHIPDFAVIVVVGISDIDTVPDTGLESLGHKALGHSPGIDMCVGTGNEDTVGGSLLVLLGIEIQQGEGSLSLAITVNPGVRQVFQGHETADILVGLLGISGFRELGLAEHNRCRKLVTLGTLALEDVGINKNRNLDIGSLILPCRV